MMKIIERVKVSFSDFLKDLKDQKFNRDFHTVLKYYYFFGFYWPSSSRKILAAVMFTITVETYVLGCVKDFVTQQREGNIPKAINNLFLFAFAISLQIQVLNVMIKSSKITELIRNLQALREDDEDHDLSNKGMQLIKIYKFFMLASLGFAALFKLGGYNSFHLLIPAVYDVLAHGVLFYFFLSINFVHAILLNHLYVTSDLLHIFCMMRIEANLKVLNIKLLHCADSEDLEENEKTLIACIQYHRNIFRYVEINSMNDNLITLLFSLQRESMKLKKIFAEFFWSKFIITYLALTTSLLIILKVKNNPFASQALMILLEFHSLTFEMILECTLWQSPD